MLIKLNGVTFNPDLIAVASWQPRDTGRCFTLYLSNLDGGRKLIFPEEDGLRLELFLAANGLVNLDGAAYNETAFKASAAIKEDLHAQEAIRNALGAADQLATAKEALERRAGASQATSRWACTGRTRSSR